MKTDPSSNRDRPTLSRRALLRVASGVTTGVMLAGCGRWLRFGADRDAPTPEPQEIHFLARPDLREAFAIDDAVEAWNAESAQQVILEDLVGDALDAAQTVQSALAAGEQAWDGYAMIEAPWVIADWVERGLIQPLDDLILVSSVPDAEKVVAGIIPSVLAVTQHEGHQYLIPANLSSISLGWFREPLEIAGVEPPQTWDEVRAAAEQIKIAAPGWTPFDALWTPLADHISLVWGATNTPLTDEGLIDWTGEASLAALRWKQEMVAAELMPADHASSLDNWLRGDTAIMNLVDALGPISQQIRGVGVSAAGLPIRREKDDPKAGTPFWSYGCAVLKNAANPQGMIDFFLGWFGPNNQATGRYAATVAIKPAYQYTYDEFIVNDPDQQWQLDMLEIVRNSVPFPANRYWWLQNTIAAAWIEKAVSPRAPLSAEQAMQSARDEMQAAIDSLSV
ncbi:MAG: extracellular solute-binding protein [Caldilineaceae bacterium]|nr:extracellular solute-binding protein [Caldilineaceae bacterium]